MLVVKTSTKKLKVAAVIDSAPLMAVRVPDGIARATIIVVIDGREYRADIASKSVRKAHEMAETGDVVLLAGDDCGRERHHAGLAGDAE
jgi:hypothetical protein